MRIVVGLLVALAGCYRIDTTPFEDWDSGADVDTGLPDGMAADAASPDGSTACEPDTIICDDLEGRYVECSESGTATVVIDCPLGCSTTSEKCLDVDPSNELATYLDMTPDGPDVVFAGASSINAEDGVVFNGAVSIDVPSVQLSGMRVFIFRSLSIDGTLKGLGGGEDSGGSAIALLVHGDVTITGLLDVSADRGVHGPGGEEGLSCDGGDIAGSSPAPGGGGGGRYGAGGAGGAAGNGTPGGTAGANLSDSDLVPLRGGCEGGFVLEGSLASYGGGGGAIQIVSRTSISITGAGTIDASGGGGESAPVPSGTIGGGGGGSGGGILLEAPQIILDGSGVVLSTKGGGGAAVGNGAAGHYGADGGTGPGAAQGGTNPGLPAGGAGGTETLAPTVGGSGSTATMDGAGGGGAVGQARFNTSAGTIAPQNGAMIRSRSTTGTLATREIP